MRRDWEPEDPGPADLRAGHRPLSSVIASAYFTLRLVTRTRALGRYRDLGAPLPERVSRKVNRSDSCPCPEIPLLGHALQWRPWPPQESRWCRTGHLPWPMAAEPQQTGPRVGRPGVGERIGRPKVKFMPGGVP